MNLGTLPANAAKDGAPPSNRARWRSILCTLVAISLGAYGAWFWWQSAHPGMIHYRQGIDYAARNQMVEAEQEWQQGVQEDPTFPGCYTALGDLFQAGHNYPAAAVKYAAAVKLSPGDGTLYFKLARVQQQLNADHDAIDNARRTAELLPGDAAAASLYGELALHAGDLPTALAAYRHAYSIRPTDPEALHHIVHLELDTRDLAGAERDLTPWLRLHPDDAEACYSMAVISGRKPRSTANIRAQIEFGTRAVAGMQHPQEADILLGQVYLDANCPQDALRAYRAAAAAGNRNNEAILSGLLECYHRLARPDEAGKIAARLKIVASRHERINSLKRALNANPADVAAGLELPRLEEEDGDLEKAHLDYLRILRQTPNDARPRQALAAFYRRTGHPDLADRAEQPNDTEETR